MGGGGSTNTVQKADPWGGQQPYLLDIFQQAQNLYQTQQPQFFPGNTIAPLNPLEKQAQQTALTAAGGQQNLAQGAAGATNFLLGDVLSPESNPYLAKYAEGAVAPIYRELNRETLPGIGNNAVAAGQYGSSRQGIAEGLARSDANQQALDTTSKIYSDAYGQGLEAMARGLAFAPQTQAGLLTPSQTVATVGTQNRAFEQALIDEAMARYNFNQSMPWDTLAAYQGLIQGNFGGTGTSSVSGGGGTAQSLLGAAGAGLSTYAGLSMMAAPTAAGGMGMTALAPIAPWAAGAIALATLFA